MSNNNDKRWGGNSEKDETWGNKETIFKTDNKDDNKDDVVNKDTTTTDKTNSSKKYVVEEFDSWDDMKLKNPTTWIAPLCSAQFDVH